MADQNSRRPLIAANWKMYKTPAESEAFLKEFLPKVSDKIDCDIVICPPFTSLSAAAALLKGSHVMLGGQNVNENTEGAFTGEVSPGMLAAVGCRYVVVGHSERRQYFGETNAGVNKKMLAALKQNLIPIVCVGETLAERAANKTLQVVDSQVKEALVNIPSADTKKIVIAYEPVWAIGTGQTATPGQAQEVHAAIRSLLSRHDPGAASRTRIVYGGSVKPSNALELFIQPDIDGGLIGGASLSVTDFVSICQSADRAAS